MNYVRASKNLRVLIALMLNKVLLKSTKPIHHWTPQLIRSTKIFIWCLLRKQHKNYLRCGRNKVFYCDFFDEADFVSGG